MVLGTSGNGDGQLLGAGLNTQFSQNVRESYNFWYHLYSAQLINFQGVTSLSGTYSETMLAQSQPAGQINNTYIIATGFGGENLNWVKANSGYYLTALTTLYGQGAFSPGLTNQQAYNIDIKLDDGAPIRKIVNRSHQFIISGRLYK